MKLGKLPPGEGKTRQWAGFNVPCPHQDNTEHAVIASTITPARWCSGCYEMLTEDDKHPDPDQAAVEAWTRQTWRDK